MEDTIDANIAVLDISDYKHAHQLLVMAQAIQSVIDRMTKIENKGRRSKLRI